MKKIYVKQSFLPPKEEYIQYIEDIFDNNKVLTNNGTLVQKIEHNLNDFLFLPENSFISYVTNGTVALQLALSALEIHSGEIITSSFSYVASTSSILWQGCKPVFVDIETDNFTIDVSKIEEKINENTKAILPVHTFGYACDIEKIEEIARKYNLKIIYDAAHAFNCIYKGKSILSYGDISTCSFHATKVFHTIEGGACFTKSKELHKVINLQRAFGHSGDEHFRLGINAKQSEFHAAMGLINLKYVDSIIKAQKKLSQLYDRELSHYLSLPKKQEELDYNYSYYPVLFDSEKRLLHTIKALNNEGIFPRRYFYPSLNTLPYVQYTPCPNSESISSRICCLPLYANLTSDDVLRICSIIKKSLS